MTGAVPDAQLEPVDSYATLTNIRSAKLRDQITSPETVTLGSFIRNARPGGTPEFQAWIEARRVPRTTGLGIST